MKLTPPGQSLFPIALMALLVGLTFWLQRATEIKDNFNLSKLRHDPDFFAENFTVRRFTSTGELQSTLGAKKMLHYPDDDTTVVSEPRIAFMKGPTRLTAEQGLVGPDGREVTLVGNVRGVRAATPTDAEIVYTSSHLTVFPDDEVARTSAAVKITQGASIVHGVGMEVDNKTQIYQLLSQVNSTIEKKSR
jgi:lipopolysaccharide export system protein LptC